MKFLVTVQNCVHLWCFLSTAVLHSVAAGGAYCAKTARGTCARAAALGLEYPGLRGAPDLSPAHNVNQPRTFNYDEMSWREPNMATYSHNQPGGSSFDTMYEQIHPRSSGRILPSRTAYLSVPSGYRTNQMLGFPRGLSVSDPESSFEEVKPVPSSQSDPMTPSPRGHRKPLLFVYTEDDLDVDESAPNRRGVSLNRRPLRKSRGRASHSPNKVTLRRMAPALYSSQLFRNDKVTSPSLAQGHWKMIKDPGHLAQRLHTTLHSKPFVQGRAILEHLRNKAAHQNPEDKEPDRAQLPRQIMSS